MCTEFWYHTRCSGLGRQVSLRGRPTAAELRPLHMALQGLRCKTPCNGFYYELLRRRERDCITLLAKPLGRWMLLAGLPEGLCPPC